MFPLGVPAQPLDQVPSQGPFHVGCVFTCRRHARVCLDKSKCVAIRLGHSECDRVARSPVSAGHILATFTAVTDTYS